MVSFICFAFFIADDSKPEKSLYYLILIPFLILMLKYIKKRIKVKGLDIIANQQRYFDEVDSKMIDEFYKNRRIIKRDRIEVSVNENSKKLMKNGYIVPEFFINYKNMELTKIENLN
ncbi:hypothetical protein F0F72_08110, partial [Campylobacter jejuni]|nr:hypothetical protein [Campylobacter jejuni]